MRQFFKFMFASMLGVFLSIFLIILIFGVILSVVVSGLSSERAEKTEAHTVLEISFDRPIRERTSKNPFENLDLNTMKSRNPLGLDQILKNIKKAAEDPHIDGIYLHVSSIQSGYATVEEIRQALVQFKKSGKFMIAYAEGFSQGAYYLVSLADKIYLHPRGEVDFKGIRAELVFVRGALEKLEIEPQVIRHGKYKSAIEPFIADKMSEENRKQIGELLDDLWSNMLQQISLSRKLPAGSLQQMADNLSAWDAREALKLKLVDGLKYEDEVMDELRSKTGKSNDENLTSITLGRYNHVPDPVKSKGFVKEKIAVIYASGTIESGDADQDNIGSDKFAETISKARKDKNVKAIVLRVNSPGGSALASDVIWREIVLAKKVKPVVVSMGDLAASGGYYISCAADSVFARENTITGSIGVFGLLFNAKKLMNNKLGITTDTYQTAAHADIGTFSRPLTETEKNIFQKSVEQIYETFTQRVADGRKMNREIVDSIGQGRVWSGVDALQIGLVDKIGGMEDAIACAARMAKVEHYRISSLPEMKEPLQELLSNLKEETEASFVKRELGESYSYYNYLQSLLKMKGIQAWLPFTVSAE